MAIGSATAALVVVLAAAGLWWRLARGPISLDLATPWLAAAIADNFGSEHRVEVGGTQLERDENGKTSLRLQDVVVRDPDGTVVASAPKAEVGLSSAGLLTGHIRAERLSLVGAAMSIRIESDGKVTVFAGADKRPIAVADPKAAPALASVPSAAAPAAPSNAPPAPSAAERFAALLAWIDALGASGLDGHDLGELGLKNGSLTVDDQRDGNRWSFSNINVSMKRQQRGVVLTVSSDQPNRRWSLSAAATPARDGNRLIKLEARAVPAKDLLLALRPADMQLRADLPISASITGEIGANGRPELLHGSIVGEAGFVSDGPNPADSMRIDRAVINFDWNAARHALVVPMQVISGGNRFTLLAQVRSPMQADGPWALQLGGGSIVLGADGKAPLALNRIFVDARFDPAKQRIELDRGELGNGETGVALSGSFDYSTPDPHLVLGVAARRMSLATLKQLWPRFVSPNVRSWMMEHTKSATVERVDIAVNAPMSTLGQSGPPIPDDGLSIAMVASGSVLRPVDGLPELHDADLNVRVTGRTATISLGHAAVELPSGRNLTMTDGLFSIPDTYPKPSPSTTRFRLDGSVAAAAELLAMDRLRQAAAAPFDPATSRGTINAQVTLALPLQRDLANAATTYKLDVELINFAADRMLMGQKVEAASLRVTADNQGYRIKGDVKIAGTPAVLDYRKPRGGGDAEVRVQSVLDDATRAKLGLDIGRGLKGPVPVKISGQIGGGDREGRFSVDADLTKAAIDDLLPGWVKPPGKPAHATFTLVSRSPNIRVVDLAVDGAGVTVRGNVDIDGSGEIAAAHFPVFSLSPGDKLSLKADRENDGALRVALRGDIYDGHNFVKAAMAGPTDAGGDKRKAPDIDLDVKVATVAGFNGETLRGLDLRLSRRNGAIRAFSLHAKLGRDTPLTGALRTGGNGRPTIYLETDDAGALFRFTDTYSKIVGGRMAVAMDPPARLGKPQYGTLNIGQFAVRGEAALERVVSGAPGTQSDGVQFSDLRVSFTRTPGRLSIRDGLVRGPVIGATIDGSIDYLHDDVRMRGTFVPLYGLNNMFGQLPIVGPFLGGSNEGLVGITYEVVGRPSAPVLRVNPISVAAPGLLRKLFEFPSGAPAFADPNAR